MPSRKAKDIEVGVVLVDPNGTMYEVMAHQEIKESVVLWLWPDDEPFPNFYQVFEGDEDINFIKQGPSTAKHVADSQPQEVNGEAAT